MSSVLSGISQIPRSSNGFIAVSAGSGTLARFFSEAQFATAISAGTVAGTQVFFATNTAATTAMTAADATAAIVALQTFKDLGKNYLLYTPQDSASGSVMGLWCVFTKVRRTAIVAGIDYEGDNGTVGYICTFSAAQFKEGAGTVGVLTSTEPYSVVARTGFGHAF